MSIRVLIADDHAIVREGLRMILNAQADITVAGEAADGREAVQLAAQLHPDVIIMDISVAELSGIETLRQILEWDGSARIIIVSAQLTSDHLARALRAGARGYLPKTATSAELVAAVKLVSQGQRYLSPRVTDLLVDDYLGRYTDTAQRSPLDRLSPREREILQLVLAGKSSAEIARALSLSPSTVGTYRSRLMEKLGIHDFPALVKFAVQSGVSVLE
ncbi:MAG: response regulator [Armatimonadota bacterium]